MARAWALLLAVTASFLVTAADRAIQDGEVFSNGSGRLQTYSAGEARLDRTNDFFRPFGSNGRSCATCHNPARDWTISADEVKTRFESTKGMDPIFQASDGANCGHNIVVTTLQERRAAYSLLLDRGLIRESLSVPPNAEFKVARADNPYGCDDPNLLSLYRRPLPATNLRALTAVMWDGRGSSVRTGPPPITSITNPADLAEDLRHQVEDASRIHLQLRRALPAEREQAIVNFEMGLATAQAFDVAAGALDAGGAKGGPVALARQILPAFFVGINDPQRGDAHTIKPEDAIRLYDAWSNLPYGRVYRESPASPDAQSGRRASIARGQVLFDQKPFDIRGVPGFNDERRPSVTGACGTCHDSPNLGNHSVSAFYRIGIDNADSPLHLTYLPTITLRNKQTRETTRTTDPGLALVTGRWEDIGKIKVPILRGLAARAPYFHNGAARSLADVVEFYDTRFHIQFSSQEKADLIAFLSVL